ncbi:MAG TPA: RsmE family RNA methyltransferase [bacterium]|nr:RsmE family RNA methyltransferase [bacterium]
MKIERFFAADIPGINGCVDLTRSESHHARHVMRIKDGAAVKLIDGHGTEATGVIRYPDGRTAQITVSDRSVFEPPALRTVLALAFPDHREVLSDVIRGAVELGATGIDLVRSEHSGIRRAGDFDKVLTRCRRIVMSAAKQSGAVWFPEVSGLFDLRAYLDGIPEDTRVFCGWEPGAGEDVSGPSDIVPGASHLVWLVGPEGGWSARELQFLARPGIGKLRLGGRTLTTRVAAIAGLSALMTGLDRWNACG